MKYYVLDVVFPPNGKMKLPPMPNEPTYNPELGEEAYKTSHRLIEARGPEEIHTRLIHNQFGLAVGSVFFIDQKLMFFSLYRS